LDIGRIDIDVLTRGIGALARPLPLRARLETGLQRVAGTAPVVFRADGAGLMLLSAGDRLRFATGTDQRAQRLEQLQETLPDGPAVTAFKTGEPQTQDVAGPGFAATLREEGVGAVLSVPVPVDDGPVGTLTLYRDDPRGWDEDAVAAVRAYAALTGGLLASALLAELKGREAAQLQWALDHRIVIERAKGALMARDRVGETEAFERMRQSARRDRRPVADVAREVLDATRDGFMRRG
jgi:GAF domain-containing protein